MEQSDDEQDDNRALKSRDIGKNDYHQVECSTEPLQGARGNTLHEEADEVSRETPLIQ